MVGDSRDEVCPEAPISDFVTQPSHICSWTPLSTILAQDRTRHGVSPGCLLSECVKDWLGAAAAIHPVPRKAELPPVAGCRRDPCLISTPVNQGPQQRCEA